MNVTISNLLLLQSYILQTKLSINMWTYRHDIDQNNVNIFKQCKDIGIGGCILGIAAFSDVPQLYHNNQHWNQDESFDWEGYTKDKFPSLTLELVTEFLGFDNWKISEAEASLIVNQLITKLLCTVDDGIHSHQPNCKPSGTERTGYRSH